jgi:tRNA(Phe) wybutosine-synthesizing methylase Tyw3
MNMNNEQGFEVDDNMVNLVEIMNTIPGMFTFSSCGGHENPDGGQVAAGQFTV